MALFTQADLIGSVPEIAQLLTLDDDNDAIADSASFEAVLAETQAWIEGFLDQAGLTLSDPPQKRIKHLAMKYAEYTLWRRRGHAERTKQLYDEWIHPGAAWLERVATGAETLLPSSGGAEVISEPARTFSSSGGLMV